MEMNCSQILRIREIQKRLAVLENHSVRTWGRVISHDISHQKAIIKCDDGQQLHVNTEMIEPYAFTIGSYYTFMGDILRKDQSDIMLCARVVFCTNALDISLFERTLDLRREHLNEKIT